MIRLVGNAEDDWEQYAKEILADLDWQPLTGDQIAPGSGERETWDELAIPSRLTRALRALNPEVPNEQLLQAAAEILKPRSNDAITENHRTHDWMTRGF